MTEEQALRQMKQGSQDALAWFIHQYGAYVSTIIYNVIGQRMSNADVEEASSDVFLALWNNAGKLHPNAARSWLATVARNTARSRLRRAQDTLPLNESTVRTKLNRGRAKLRDFLTREGHNEKDEKGGTAWNTTSMI